jgi:transposase
MTLGVRFAIEKFVTMWLGFNEQIKEIEAKMKLQAIEDKSIDTVYQSVPGIGPISSRVLANELGNLQQFRNERQLFSYIGFTPSEHSSGEHTRQGHITKQGKPILRKILVQVAWTAIRYDKEVRMIYERIAARSGCKRAIIAIARRLIGRIKACFRTEMLYEKVKIDLSKNNSEKEKRLQKKLVA